MRVVVLAVEGVDLDNLVLHDILMNICLRVAFLLLLYSFLVKCLLE